MEKNNRLHTTHLNELSKWAVPYLSPVFIALTIQFEICRSISNFEETWYLRSSVDLRPQVLEHVAFGHELLGWAPATRHAKSEGVDDVTMLT